MYLPDHPRPWSIENTPAGAVVFDADGLAIAAFDAENDSEFWEDLVSLVNEHALTNAPAMRA